MFQFNFGNRFGKNYREVPPEGGEEQPRQKKWGRGSGAKHVKKAAAGIVIALIAVFLASSCWYNSSGADSDEGKHDDSGTVGGL